MNYPSRRMRLCAFSIFFLLLTSLFLPRARAQAVFGSIVGTVSDPTGAVIPNATVTVTDVAKGVTQTVQTNASGNYTVSRLIPDTYDVKVTSQSFTPAEAKSVIVAADSAPQVNLTLQAGGAAQTVTVTTAAPPLNTDRPEVSQSLNQRQVQDLPNINRNLTEYTLLTPGTQRSSFSVAPTQNPQGSLTTEINGSNYGEQGFELDGTDNREPVLGIVVINPTLDSVSDMKVISQDYPAEFGGAVGGFITVQTKSGSNAFHGDVFEFRRSDAQQARDPFVQFQPDAVTGKYIPSSLYNQFGGSLGGPILKDKAFFFMDYQGQRQRIGTSLQQNVPTLNLRNTCLSGAATCDLSQYTKSVYDPATKTTYAANAVPSSVLTPQGINLLKSLPLPNATGTSNGSVNNYVSSGNGTDNGDQADVRLDAQVTQRMHAFGRYDYALFRLFGAPVFGAAGGTGFGLGNTTGTDEAQNQSVAAGFDYAINPSLLTDFRFGFLDYHVAENKYDQGTQPALAAGIPNLNTSEGDTSGSPTYNVEDGTISNFGTQGCNCPLLESEQVFQVVNNWTKNFGNHSVRFGADLRYALNLRNASDYNRTGQLSFGNGSTGSGVASVLLGYVDTFQRFDVYTANSASRQKRGAFYAEDTWRVTPKLTVDYGLRWDIVFPETVASAAGGGFTDLQNGVIRVAGAGGIGTNGNASLDLTDLGGRLGVAYQLTDRTVLRAAAAQMYDDAGFFGTVFGSVLTHNIPAYNDEDVTSGNATGQYTYTYGSLPGKPAPYVIPANGIIPIPNGVNTEIRPQTLVLPRVDQWNLSLQQQISNNTTFTVAYVGNLAERIYPGETYGYNVNIPVLPSATTNAGQQAFELSQRNQRRPYYNRFTSLYNGAVVQCCNQDITSAAPAARANYNALQTTVDKRFSSGLQFTANYTWSKAMNYNSTYFAQDPRVEYGPNDTNRTNVFVMNAVYELPFGKGKMLMGNANRWVNYAVGGWQIAGNTTWESGLPFTPTYAECGSDQDIDSNYGTPGTSSDCRPDKIAGGHIFPLGTGSLDPVTHSIRYFSPVGPLATQGAVSGPFVRPQFGSIGNIGRNAFRGPSDYFADASLFKNFAITERVQGQFQFQAFNVFNHLPLGLPSSTNSRCIDCSNGGLITGVDSAVSGTGLPYMRQLQFGARLSF